jgi:hypothetical protein
MTVLAMDNDEAFNCFREDAGKGRHLKLVIVRDSAAVRQFDRLDTDLQERPRIKDVATAENLPFGGFRHRDPIYGEHGEQIKAEMSA